MRGGILLLYFLISLLLFPWIVISVKGSGEVTVKPLFEIVSYFISPKKITLGEEVSISLTIKNNDNIRKTFYIELAVQDPDENWQPLSPQAIALEPKAIGTIIFYWTVSHSAIPGYYEVKIAIKTSEPPVIETKEIDNAFEVVIKGKEETVNLAVPYIHQYYDTPDDFDGRDACGATSTVMVLLYYRKLSPWPCECSKPFKHISEFGNYISRIYTYNGYTFDTMTPDASGKPAYGAYGFIHNNRYHLADSQRIKDYLYKHGINSESPLWVYGRPPEEINKIIVDALVSGKPVIASIEICSTAPEGKRACITEGHVIVIKGFSNAGRYYIINDPYGKYALGGYDGMDVQYSIFEKFVYKEKEWLVKIKWIVIPTEPPG